MLERSHPICAAIEAASAAVAEVADVDPLFMRPGDQVDALMTITVLETQLTELKSRVIVPLDQSTTVAEDAGAKDLGFWLNQQTRLGLRQARAAVAFAHRLHDHPLTAAAMRTGSVSAAQADVICRAVDALPDDLTDDLAPQIDASVLEQAERQLLADARAFDPGALRVLGARILEAVAPEIAEAAEAAKLEAAERRAAERVRLSLRKRGDGISRLIADLPDRYAAQLAVILQALLNPRRTPSWAEAGPTDAADPTDDADQRVDGDRAPPSPAPWWALPAPYKLGQAFCEMLDRIDPKDLPTHGTTITTLVVTIPLDRLESGLGAATLHGVDGPERLSAAEARRLACTSGIIPAVLGSKGEVLDLGRSARLFSAAQKRALGLTQPTCRTAGCTMPASHCEGHHMVPWEDGGRTDLENGKLLCSYHHHRIHDAALTYEIGPDGLITFLRR